MFGPLLAIALGGAFLIAELVFLPFIIAHMTDAVSAKRGTVGFLGMTVVAVAAVVGGIAALRDRRNST
jgi:hypothetical protein